MISTNAQNGDNDDQLPSIVSQVFDLVKSRGNHAIELSELRAACKIHAKTFYGAIQRLENRGDIFRWKTDRFQEYVVQASRRDDAYYLEEIYSRTSAFDACGTVVTVKRSPPVVMLADGDIKEDGTFVPKIERWKPNVFAVA